MRGDLVEDKIVTSTGNYSATSKTVKKLIRV